MIAVSLSLSVTQLRCAGVIRCSLCRITLAACFTFVPNCCTTDGSIKTDKCATIHVSNRNHIIALHTVSEMVAERVLWLWALVHACCSWKPVDFFLTLRSIANCIINFRLQQMHEMQTIATDELSVCLSVSVTQLNPGRQRGMTGASVQAS